MNQVSENINFTYPICHFLMAKKFVDKSGCEKSEDALYVNRDLSRVEPLILYEFRLLKLQNKGHTVT